MTTHFKSRYDKITQNIYNKKKAVFEKWAHVADIWMNLKNEESKQMVEESNSIITSRIRNRIYAETWKI